MYMYKLKGSKLLSTKRKKTFVQRFVVAEKDLVYNMYAYYITT